MSAYLTHLSAYITVCIANVEEDVIELFTYFRAHVTGVITSVVVGVGDRTGLSANITISVAIISVCMRGNVATLFLMSAGRLVPMTFCIGGPCV
jgi:hypothetical protein